MARSHSNSGYHLFIREDKTLNIQNIYIIALLLGVMTIVFGKYLGSMHLAVALPVLIMFGYIFLGYYKESAKPIIDQFADSIYYMGFLYTLTALIISLYSFESENIGQLVANFAIALITTIVGLAARITITNFHGDLASTQFKVQAGLDKATGSLIRNALKISMRLESLDTEIHDTIRKSLEDSNKQITKTYETIKEETSAASESLSSAIQKSSNAVEKAINDLSDRLDGLELPQDIYMQKLSVPVERYTERLAESDNVLKDLNLQQRAVRDNTRKIADGLEKTILRIQGADQALDVFTNNLEDDVRSRQELSGLIRDVAGLSGVIKGVSEEIMHQSESTRSITSSLAVLLDNINTLPAAMLEVTTQAERSAKALTQVTDNFESGSMRSGEISESISSIAKAISDSNEKFASLSAVTETIGNFVKQIELISTSIANQEGAIKITQDAAAKQLNMLSEHQVELERILGNSRESIEAINTHFVDAVNYISDRLGPGTH